MKNLKTLKKAGSGLLTFSCLGISGFIRTLGITGAVLAGGFAAFSAVSKHKTAQPESADVPGTKRADR